MIDENNNEVDVAYYNYDHDGLALLEGVFLKLKMIMVYYLRRVSLG